MLKSIYFELSIPQRNKDLATHPFLSGAALWYGYPPEFSDLADEGWWRPPAGFQYVPVFHSAAADVWPTLEEDAVQLATAAFPARAQSERVADVALTFAATNAQKLAVLCVLELRPPSLMQYSFKDEQLPTLVSNLLFTKRPETEATISEEELVEELNDWLNVEFPSWVVEFIRELFRWKAPDADAVTGKTSPEGGDGSSGEASPLSDEEPQP